MKWTLRNLIQVVALLAIVLTFLTITTVGYRVNKLNLTESTLETNKAYAQKLSSTTDTFLREVLRTLAVNAEEVIPLLAESDNQAGLDVIANRVQKQSDTFNSVVIADAEGTVIGVSPPSLDLLGEKLTSTGVKQAMEEKRPLISEPYVGVTGELMIFISVPLFTEDLQYEGFMGGAIYLNKSNVLEKLLGKHFYENGSNVYVVDRKGMLIYHQLKERLKDDVAENPVVQKVIAGAKGSQELVNTKGVPMLAGYSHVPIAGWGIVSQRTVQSSVAPAKAMVGKMALRSLPLLLLSIFLIWYLSRKIASPLQNLAHYAALSTKNRHWGKIETISDWYYEAWILKKSVQQSLDYFIHQSHTDPLTGLTNRRAMNEYMNIYVKEKTPFAVIILDIDHFKRVNDRYGHAVGDEVLIELADLMRKCVRKEDICCRYGGEEFVILLPQADELTAYDIAERLRETMENKVSACGEVVTISAGTAASQGMANNPAKLIELADQSLYEAKRTGRNKTIISGNES